MARLVRPDGRFVVVEDGKVAPAIKAGYRYSTVKEDEQRDDAAEPGTAGAAGLLRGASAGLSDPLLVGAGEVLDKLTGTSPVRPVKEQLTGLRTENPLASTAGEVGGTIAGLAAGPVAAIAKVGGAARVAAGAGVKGALVAGATEGTLYGLGTVISEGALGDTQTNAEKLAGIGGAGLFGAGLNLATHGAGAVAASALTKAFGGKTLNAALDDLANAGLQAQLGSKKVMNKRNLYGKNADEVFSYAREKGLFNGGDTNDSFLQKVTTHRQGIGEETGAILDQASARTAGFDVQALKKRVTTDLIPELQKDPSNRGSVAKISQYMEDLEALGPKGHDLKSAWGLQSSLKNQVGFGEADGLMKGNLSKFRNLIREEIKDQANKVSPHFGSQLDDTSNRYRMAKSLEDLAEEQVRRQEANGMFGLRDTILGAAAFGGGGPGGAIAAVGSKMARERGGFMLAAAADKLANSKTLERLADGLKLSVQGLSESGLLGAYRPILDTAAARGSMNLLATHVQLAQSDPKYLPTLGMQSEEGDAANQYAGRAEQLDRLAQQLQKHDDDVNASLGRFLRQKSGAYPTATKSKASMEDFEKRLQRITQVLQDPSTVDTSGLASTAPALAMQSSVQAQNAAGFLLSKAPKNPNAGLPAFHQPWTVSQADLGKFYRYVDAAERPTDVLKELAKNGTVTKEAVETMQVLYPMMLEDMKAKLMDRLTEYDKPLSYNQRRGLGSLFGDGFINRKPQQLALLQGIHAGSVGGQEQGGPKKDGRQNQSQEDNVSTQAQRIENR